jgi:hypothetical protein
MSPCVRSSAHVGPAALVEELRAQLGGLRSANARLREVIVGKDELLAGKEGLLANQNGLIEAQREQLGNLQLGNYADMVRLHADRAQVQDQPVDPAGRQARRLRLGGVGVQAASRSWGRVRTWRRPHIRHHRSAARRGRRPGQHQDESGNRGGAAGRGLRAAGWTPRRRSAAPPRPTPCWPGRAGTARWPETCGSGGQAAGRPGGDGRPVHRLPQPRAGRA